MGTKEGSNRKADEHTAVSLPLQKPCATHPSGLKKVNNDAGKHEKPDSFGRYLTIPWYFCLGIYTKLICYTMNMKNKRNLTTDNSCKDDSMDFDMVFPEDWWDDDATNSQEKPCTADADLYADLCGKGRPEGMTTDEGMNLCRQYVRQAREILQEQGAPWEVTGLAKQYIRLADWLKGYEHLTNSLYSCNKEMLGMIHEHPRLKRKLLYIQLDVLHDIEAHSGGGFGASLTLTEETMTEIDFISKCISLADDGRLDEIPPSGRLKHDPIEWTVQWEKVVDDADREAYRKLEDMPRGMGWVHAFWHQRREALARSGVAWRSPALMNPGVLFD